MAKSDKKKAEKRASARDKHKNRQAKKTEDDSVTVSLIKVQKK